MKKFFLTITALFCFGIAKAHFLPKHFKTLKPQMEVLPINALPDYNVTFKFHRYHKLPILVFAPVPSEQNKLAVLSFPVTFPKQSSRRPVIRSR